MTEEKQMTEITERLKSAVNTINDSNMVDEGLCKEIVKDLDTLVDLRKDTIMEVSMNTDIEVMLSDFYKQSVESKEVLQDILHTVDGGKVPDTDLIFKASTYIEQLRDKYDAIEIYASQVLSEEELPAQGSAVSEYAFAISNSKAMITKQRMQSIRRLLDDFTAVYSLVEMYAKALEPYQSKARELMAKIDKGDIGFDEVSDQSSNAEVFMDAFECSNYGTPEGAELLKKVSEKIDFNVSMGLSSRSYLTDRDSDNNDPKSISKKENDTEIVPDNRDKYENAGATEKASVTESEGNTQLSLVDLSDEKKNTNIKTEEAKTEETEEVEAYGDTKDISDEEPISDIVNKIIDSGLVKETELNKEKVETEIGSGEEKKISSTIFVNDLRKGNTKLASKILSSICHEGMLTDSYLALVTGSSEEMAGITLEYLLRKGYLRKYSISLGEIYSASPKLIKAISYKDASKFIDVAQYCLEEEECLLNPTPEVIANGLARSKVFEMLHKEYSPQSTTYESFLSDRTSVVRIAYDRNDEYPLIVCSAFWPSNNEWDVFFEELGKQLNKKPAITTIVVTGINKEFVEELIRIIGEEQQSVVHNLEIRGYSLEADEEIELDNGNPEDEDEVQEHVLADTNDSVRDDDYVTELTTETTDEQTSVVAKENTEEQDPVIRLLSEGLNYAALAYEKAASAVDEQKKLSYQQLAYAFNDPSASCTYSSDSWFNLIGSGSEVEDATMISAAMRLFFSDQVRFDHNLRSVYSAISEYSLLELMPTLKNLLYEMAEFKMNYKGGLDRYADYRKKSQKELDNDIQETRRSATDFYNKTITGNKKEKTNHRRFIETMKMVFSPSGELGECIKFVVDGEADAKSTIEEFLKEHFYSNDAEVSEETINDDLLWDYITSYWDIAGERMATRKRDDLKGHLKTNIINSTKKAVQILARWCCLVADAEKNDEDEGEIAYRKIRTTLLEKADESLDCIRTNLLDSNLGLVDKAGLMVINITLMEVKSRLEGTYSEARRRCFYKDFLLTDDVMLTENYLPDLDCYSTNLEKITPQYRILQHAEKRKASNLKFENRLTEILDEQGDDYGAAKLIVDYLSVENPEKNYEKQYSEIESGEAYAKETAGLRKTDFIGELELAQSYGQIDNSVENQKEIILKALDDWFEWASETSNYGFFKKVIDEYRLDIRRNAKIREKDILSELEAYKKANIANLTVEEKAKRIAKIQSAIKELNYTVAEDLLSRKDADEDTIDALIEEDFLKDFLDNYDDFYQPVANKNASLASLVKNRTRNKEERGAKRLADSWLPGGSSLGKLRLESLLNTLGFDVEEIREQKTIGKLEEYKVQTVGAFTRQRNSYTHPIASLGSGMAEEGLRVVCINGAYDADGLIDVMKQIGNAKPTLILLDYALSLVERRKLARKTKNSLGDKLFAVLDRTAMMYLIRNYDETKINRMLVSLIVPFAYYQPYVWESANVMPPEIFMGRRFELEKIKSPTGVNIVYGGRQLGKSALLKKAKEDIDWDENGDRAIYIDIKGLDYSEAARKISHELHDQFVLDEDLNTDEWDVLTRALKKRLQSEKKRIPYLLLLLDEADTFIESCAQINYKPFDSLKELQNIGVGRFKFVIAGLRDIVRFKRDALKNNSVLTHLEPMTVTPFNFAEARELMEIPLHYLGLRFPKDKESLITLIMATTNYFPGLIQLYCAKLVDAMRNKDYAGYDVVDSPVYEVSEEHIKKVLADPDFMGQIREKFEITLKLDEDNYYYLIALTMAWLYHNEGLNASYTADDIKRVGEDYGIKKLAKSDIDKLENLMIELKELNVLRSADDKYFRFTRFTFFQMMGTSDEVDNKLQDYMEA